MDEAQRREITEKFKTMAVLMDRREFSREEYSKLFPSGTVKTPIDTVKLGTHQFEKLKVKHREKLLGAMKQTLEEPIVVLKEVRDGKLAHIYIKSFSSKRNEGTTNVITVVVDIKGTPIAISTSERRQEQIDAKIKTAGNPLYIRGDGSPTLGTEGSLESKPSLPGTTPTGAGSAEAQLTIYYRPLYWKSQAGIFARTLTLQTSICGIQQRILYR